MKVELTKVWFERKQFTQEKEIEEGLCVEYYKNGFNSNDTPSEGYIRKDERGFFIEWTDTEHDTILNDSEHTKEILKQCGWY